MPRISFFPRPELLYIPENERIIFMNQVHGNDFQLVDEKFLTNFPEIKRSNLSELNLADFPSVDGLITNLNGVNLAVRAADCLPVLISAGDHVAALHAGRRGIENKILSKVLNKLWDLNPGQHFEITVGPHICGDCYEVSSEIYQAVVSINPATALKERHLDLFNGLRAEAEEFFNLVKSSGVVQQVGSCVRENSLWPSHRANGSKERLVGVISR
jgi:polyphenol oxidase